MNFFVVNLDSLSRISVEASGDISLLEMTLLNQDGQELAQATKDSGESVVLSAEFLGAGTYWIRVQNQVPQVLSENYSIAFTANSYPPQPRNIVITQEADQLVVVWDAVPVLLSTMSTTALVATPFAQANEGTSPLSATTNTATLSGLPRRLVYVWVRAVVGDLVGPYSQSTVFGL